MTIKVCGINHKQADLTLRERCVVPDHTLPQMLEQLINIPHIVEAMVLSTCNRTELIIISDHQFDPTRWLANYFDMQDHNFPSYSYHNEDAIKHLIEVACGLDSMVLGETQILGQMKNAFEKAKQNKTIGSKLNRLLPFIFNAGKHIRTNTDLNKHAGTVPAIIRKLNLELLPKDSQPRILFVGASNMNHDVAKALAIYNLQPTFWVNRTHEKAIQFAQQLGGQAIQWQQLKQYLPQVDMIISATASNDLVIDSNHMGKNLKQQLYFDLAVPRDIDPNIQHQNKITLFHLDDLQKLLQEGQAVRKQSAALAYEQIQKFINAYKIDQTHQEHAVLITNYRAQAEELRLLALNNALTQLQNGVSAEEVCNQLSIQLTARLLHHPTLGLRDMITRSDKQTIACLAARLEKQK